MLCAYIRVRREAAGEEWFEKWVTSQFRRDPQPVGLLFELAWRCGVTKTTASMLTTILGSDQVSPSIVGQLAFGRWNESLEADVLEPLVRAIADTGHHETAIGIIAHRVESHTSEIDKWRPLALQLVTSPDIIRSGHTAGCRWSDVAKIVIADHSKEIATAIFREQADRESGCWFVEHSEATEVLRECLGHDASEVWKAMQPFLSSQIGASFFTIGFPRGLVELMPRQEVRAWIAESPDERAAILARLTNKDMSSDETSFRTASRRLWGQ